MAAKRDPATETPPTVIGDDAILTIRQAANVSPFGEKLLRAAIDSGELEGRLVGGSTGYTTTWKALCAYATGKGKQLENPPKAAP